MVLDKVKKFFETEKRLRGFRFYFLINKILNNVEQQKFEAKLKSTDILTKHSPGIAFTFSPNYIKKNGMCIKICCNTYIDAKIKPSDSQTFYEDLFKQYTKYVLDLFKKEKISAEIYDFGLRFRVYPEENSGEYIPLCSLDGISNQILDKPLNKNIPKNNGEMIDYLKTLEVFDKKILDIMFEMAKKENQELWGAFSIQNKYTNEIDIILHTPSGEQKDNEEMITLAIQLKNEGRFEEARGIYDSLLLKNPDDELVLLNKAILLKNLNKIADAIKIYDTILSRDPNNFGALANKGSALQVIYEDEEAIKYYDRALKIQPDQPTIIKNRADAIEELKSNKKLSKVDELARKASVAYLLGKYDESLDYFNTLIKIDSKKKEGIKELMFHVFNAKAVSLIEKKDYTSALVLLKKCDELMPNHVANYTNKGLCYEKLEKYDLALENYKQAVKIDSKQTAAWNNLGYVLFLTGKYSESIKCYDKALQISPLDIRVLNNRQSAMQMIS